MASAAFNTADVVITEANILYAPKGTAIPAINTVAWNNFAPWASGWVHLGYTAQPLQFNYSFDTVEAMVEQSITPVMQRKTRETLTVDVALAQFNGPNLALLLGGTNSTTAPGTGIKGRDVVVAGGDANLAEWLFGIEGYRPDAAGTKQPVRIFIHRATVRMNGNIQMSKTGQTVLPLQITGLADSTKTVGQQLIQIEIVTAPGT